MATKCYYCGGSGCSYCQKMTTSSYGEIEQERANAAASKPPSPNGTDTKVTSKLVPPRKETALEILNRMKKEAAAKPKEKLYGFTSKQAGLHVIYRRPDGSEVALSFVGSSPDSYKTGTGWTDAICIGEVTEYVRKI